MSFFNTLPFLSFLVLSGILIERILFLKKKGIRISSKAGREKRTVFLLPAFGLVLLLWLFEVVKPALCLSFFVLPESFSDILIQNNFVRIMGAVFLVCALFLWTVTLIHFKNSLRFGLNSGNQGHLITSGIFSFSRNPFFLSLDIYFLGITLVFPNLFFIVFTIVAIISIHFFILKEERFLTHYYGEEYRNYCRKTSRYLALFRK